MILENYHIEHYQSELFSEYIQGIKIYKFTGTSIQKLHPEGQFDMIFQLNSDFLHNTPNTQGWEVRPKSFVGGLHNKSYYIQPKEDNATLLSIQFNSASATHFIKEDLHLFKNKIVDLNDFMEKNILNQILKIEDVRKGEKCVKIVDDLLIQLFKEKKSDQIQYGVKSIKEYNGNIDISSVVEMVNMSPSNFRKKFNERVGMSPKEYSKVIRINNILSKMNSQSKVKLTDMAYDNGYFDHSHFIKDFKAITGDLPKSYVFEN